MSKCPICSEYLIWNTHKCKPSYYVWDEEEEFYDIYDSKRYKVFAIDSEQAAIKFAERDWEFPNYTKVYVALENDINKILDDNPDDDFTDAIIKLILEKSKKFEIEGEMTKIFNASEIK
jgi:hypothetical protein